MVYCFDIECQIYRNENVAQCEVVGLNIGDYEVPVAHIILEKECEISEEQVIKDIHSYCVQNLPKNSVPCGYKICSSFPVKSSGKRDMELIMQDRKGFLRPLEEKMEQVNFE